MFNTIYYETKEGKCPSRDFILSCDASMHAKILGNTQVLREKGNLLREPYSKHLEDGIFELRSKVGSNISRVMIFFYYNQTIVFTNGFMKKSQRTPKSEIELAKKYRKDFIERMENNDYI